MRQSQHQIAEEKRTVAATSSAYALLLVHLASDIGQVGIHAGPQGAIQADLDGTEGEISDWSNFYASE